MDRSCWSCASSPASGTDGIFSECRSLSWIRGASWLSPRARHCLQIPGDKGRVQHTTRRGRQRELEESKVCRKINQLLKTNTKGQVFPPCLDRNPVLIASKPLCPLMAPYLASSSLSLAVWIQLLVTVTVWLCLKASAHRAALAVELRVPTCLFPTCIIDEPSFP